MMLVMTSCTKKIVISDYCQIRATNPIPDISVQTKQMLQQDHAKPVKDFLKVEILNEQDLCP